MKKNSTQDIRLGATIRRLRRERQLSQQALANMLGISTPYLNLIENNRRNVTGKILLTLAKEFNIELSEIGNENDSGLLSNLMEVFSDTVFDDNYLKNHDIQDLVSSQPEIARAVIRLYDIHKTSQIRLRDISDLEGDQYTGEGMSNNISAEIISDLIQKKSNYFPSLEEAANKILIKLNKPKNINLFVPLSEYLSSEHNIRVATIPPEIKHDTIRYYDPVSYTHLRAHET